MSDVLLTVVMVEEHLMEALDSVFTLLSTHLAMMVSCALMTIAALLSIANMWITILALMISNALLILVTIP
jgi:hypothetical protein